MLHDFFPTESGTNMKDTTKPSENTLAMNDFAAWMRLYRSRVQPVEPYEIRPCTKVRGFMLRLPAVGWKFWFSSAAGALSFVHRMAPVYSADCLVYDSNGHPSITPAARIGEARRPQSTSPGPAARICSSLRAFAGTTTA